MAFLIETDELQLVKTHLNLKPLEGSSPPEIVPKRDLLVQSSIMQIKTLRSTDLPSDKIQSTLQVLPSIEAH